MKFTDRSILHLKPKDYRFIMWETNGRGFGLRLSPKGRKTFVTMYRFKGIPRMISHGVYPQMSLAMARRLHAQVLEKLSKGVDPGTEIVNARKEFRRALTVEDMVAEYIELRAKPRKRSWAEDARILKADVLPMLGSRKASDVTRRDIITLLE